MVGASSCTPREEAVVLVAEAIHERVRVRLRAPAPGVRVLHDHSDVHGTCGTCVPSFTFLGTCAAIFAAFLITARASFLSPP